MKGILTQSAAAMLILTYLLSYIGFGIHTCSCSGSTEVILLFNNLSCETIHTHIHLIGTGGHHQGDGCGPEDDHSGCVHHHREGCCHTDIMVLTDDQDDSRQTEMVPAAFHTPEHPSLPDGHFQSGYSCLPCLSERCTGGPPPRHPHNSYLTFISVLRV